MTNLGAKTTGKLRLPTDEQVRSVMAFYRRGYGAAHIGCLLNLKRQVVDTIIAQAGSDRTEPLYLGPSSTARLFEDSPVEVALQALSAARPPEYVPAEQSVDGRAGVIDRGKHRPRRAVDNIGPDGRSLRV